MQVRIKNEKHENIKNIKKQSKHKNLKKPTIYEICENYENL